MTDKEALIDCFKKLGINQKALDHGGYIEDDETAFYISHMYNFVILNIEYKLDRQRITFKFDEFGKFQQFE